MTQCTAFEEEIIMIETGEILQTMRMIQEENFDRFKCATQDRINELKNNSKKSSIMGNLGVYIGIIIVILICQPMIVLHIV